MSSGFSVVQPILKDKSTRIYLYCCPVTQQPPADLSGISKLAEEYWSARICVSRTGERHFISKWFSLPKSNLSTALGKWPEGPFFACLDAITEARNRVLLSETTPIFEFTTSMQNHIKKWFSRRRE